MRGCKASSLQPSTGLCKGPNIIDNACGGGGDTRPLPRDGGVEELHGDPTVGPRPKVWNGRSSDKDGAPKRLECGTIQEEVSQILQRVSAGAALRILFPFYPAWVRGQEKAVTVAAKSG